MIFYIKISCNFLFKAEAINGLFKGQKAWKAGNGKEHSCNLNRFRKKLFNKKAFWKTEPKKKFYKESNEKFEIEKSSFGTNLKTKRKNFISRAMFLNLFLLCRAVAHFHNEIFTFQNLSTSKMLKTDSKEPLKMQFPRNFILKRQKINLKSNQVKKL